MIIKISNVHGQSKITMLASDIQISSTVRKVSTKGPFQELSPDISYESRSKMQLRALVTGAGDSTSAYRLVNVYNVGRRHSAPSSSRRTAKYEWYSCKKTSEDTGGVDISMRTTSWKALLCCLHATAWASSTGCATTQWSIDESPCGDACSQSHLLHSLEARPEKWSENAPETFTLLEKTWFLWEFGQCNNVVTLTNVCSIKIVMVPSSVSEEARNVLEFVIINLYSFIQRFCPWISILWHFPSQHIVWCLVQLFADFLKFTTTAQSKAPRLWGNELNSSAAAQQQLYSSRYQWAYWSAKPWGSLGRNYLAKSRNVVGLRCISEMWWFFFLKT